MRLSGLACVVLMAAGGCAKVIGADFDDAHLAEPGTGGAVNGSGGGPGAGASGAGTGGADASAGAAGANTGGTTSGGAGGAAGGAGGQSGAAGASGGGSGGTAGDGGSGGEAGGPGDTFPIVFNEVNGREPEPDFVELVNVSDAPFDLSNYRLADAESDGTPKPSEAYRFPTDTVLQPGERLLVVVGQNVAGCGGYPEPCHKAVFGIKDEGENLFVLEPLGERIRARVTYPDARLELLGRTYSRIPDATGEFVFAPPTPGEPNSLLPP